MASNPVVNTLTFAGSVAGQASISAQGIAGGLTLLLPNLVPVQGQLLTAASINGNNVFLGWSSAQSLSNIPLSALAQSGATTNQIIEWNGTAWAPASAVPGAGTVTSVALTAPAEFTVGGSPITTSGTLAITKASQSQNLVWASPNGSSGVPVFRALVVADIPNLSSAYLPASTVLAQNRPAATHNFLTAYDSSTGLFSIAQPAVTDVSGAAPLASPTFTGVPAAPTATPLTNSTQIATTAYADLAVGVEKTRALAAEALLAPLASPSFTGTVTAPTIVGSGAGVLNISESTGGVIISGAVGGKGVLVGTVVAADGVALWDNTGSNFLSVSATAGGLVFQTSGGGTFAFSGGSLTQAGAVSIDNSANTSVSLTVKGNSSADIARFTHANNAAAVQVTSAGDLYIRNHAISDNGAVAGTVTITNPATTVAVVYDVAFTGSSNPSVVATASGADPSALGGVWITHQGGSGAWTGFTINVTTTPGSTASFGYNVIGS